MKKFLYISAVALFMTLPVMGAAGAAEPASDSMGADSMGPDGMGQESMMQEEMTMPQGATGDTMASRLDPETIRSVQQALNDEGFRDTPVDGSWGVSTQASLLDFQRERGLMATGQPDTQTLQALGVQPSKADKGQRTMMRPESGDMGAGGGHGMGMGDGMHTGDR